MNAILTTDRGQTQSSLYPRSTPSHKAICALFLCALFSCTPDAPEHKPKQPSNTRSPVLPPPKQLPSPQPLPDRTSPDALDNTPTPRRSSPPSLPWLDWVVSHCHIDELGPSKYASLWMDWVRKEPGGFAFMPDDAPKPNLKPQHFPPFGSDLARQKAAALRKDWLENPRSHVVECDLLIDKRDCPSCKPVHRRAGTRKGKYTAYLPKALFVAPDTVRSLLLLAPGGNGGHTRYFLTPVPNKHVTLHKRSGGLELKRHADTFYKEHPDHRPSIILATTNGGWSMANGHIEYLSHDLPKHVADLYLDGLDPHKLTLGVEGISRGSRAIVIALRQKPNAFNTVGLTCLHCGKHGGGGSGYQPDVDLRDPVERQQWLSALAQRADLGLFRIRFSVGNADPQWRCNKRFHNYLVQGGVVDDLPPTYTNCRPRRTHAPSPHWCDTVWDGFHLFDRMPHHYALLKPSWVPQLRWHLDNLNAIAILKERSNSPQP